MSRVSEMGEMEAIFLRFLKAMIMAAIMMGSAWMLTADARSSIILALVPFVLGLVNIQTHFAYMLSAAVFLVAVALQILGQDLIVEARSTMEEFAQNARVIHTRPAAPTTAPVKD
jgi:uncharacterized membrane protein